MEVSMMGRPTPGVSGRGTDRLLLAVPGEAMMRCPAAPSDDSVKTTDARKVLC
jgi:hypothetical protein